MDHLLVAFGISCAIQILHSIEEIVTHFERRWPLWKMSRATFVLFELLFSLLFLYVLVAAPSFQDTFARVFLLLMFANGVWHLFWAGSEKTYVPGLITAPLHILNSAIYFLR